MLKALDKDRSTAKDKKSDKVASKKKTGKAVSKKKTTKDGKNKETASRSKKKSDKTVSRKKECRITGIKKSETTVQLKKTSKPGDVVGKMYDSSDSPIGEIVVLKTGFRLTGQKTGKSVESKNLRKLVASDYLTVTGDTKFTRIRWARTKNFNISNYAKVWSDKKPHWSMDSKLLGS